MKSDVTCCPFCHLEISPTESVCYNCGAVFCSNCRYPLNRESNICSKCGFLNAPEKLKGGITPGSSKARTSNTGIPAPGLKSGTRGSLPRQSGVDSSSGSQTQRCPRCGTEADSMFKSCPKCGLLYKSKRWVEQSESKATIPQVAKPVPVATSHSFSRPFQPDLKGKPAAEDIKPGNTDMDSGESNRISEQPYESNSIQTMNTPVSEVKENYSPAVKEPALETSEASESQEKEPSKPITSMTYPEPTVTSDIPQSGLPKYPPGPSRGQWQLPPITVLDKPTLIELNQSEIEKRAKLIEEAINSYGVEAKVVQINVGPTVTQFGVEPGWDRKFKKVRARDSEGNMQTRLEEVSKTRVKVERISALDSDLALALAAPNIRIEAPVPGKSVVGIEVPNNSFEMVNLRGVVESPAFQKAYAKSKLAIALGKGTGGEPVVAELDRMPHLLIAGATGSGKTACLNSIICSLLIYNTPDDIQFIMIDPKRVELVNFERLPHQISPVVVEPEKAILALRWLSREMDNRYQKFARVGVRNIEGFNNKGQNGETMPFIVLFIDELADLMMTASEEVERSICRLAQLARATGIHLIVATQRPSVDVVTGLIKANFPTRISFALTSQVDSRTVLDSAGAEKLLGKGDMLFLPTDASKPKRLQGTFVSDTEIDNIVSYWERQRKPESKPIRFEEIKELVSNGKGEEDSLMESARQLTSEQKNISASFLQRRLSIGYPRAARIMEKLKEEGYGNDKVE